MDVKLLKYSFIALFTILFVAILAQANVAKSSTTTSEEIKLEGNYEALANSKAVAQISDTPPTPTVAKKDFKSLWNRLTPEQRVFVLLYLQNKYNSGSETSGSTYEYSGSDDLIEKEQMKDYIDSKFDDLEYRLQMQEAMN